MENVGYQTNDLVSHDGHWWFWGRNQVVEGALRTLPLSRDSSSILDFGAGVGGMVPFLSRFGRVTAVEPSTEARAIAVLLLLSSLQS